MSALLVGFSKQSQAASAGVILHTDLCESLALYLNLNDQLAALKYRNNPCGLLSSCANLQLPVGCTKNHSLGSLVMFWGPHRPSLSSAERSMW